MYAHVTPPPAKQAGYFNDGEEGGERRVRIVLPWTLYPEEPGDRRYIRCLDEIFKHFTEADLGWV